MTLTYSKPLNPRVGSNRVSSRVFKGDLLGRSIQMYRMWFLFLRLGLDCEENKIPIIDYVNNKYGSESVAHIITFGTLASRAAVRDIGRVLEVPYGEVDSFAKLIPFNPSNPLTLAESIKSEKSLRDIINTDENG